MVPGSSLVRALCLALYSPAGGGPVGAAPVSSDIQTVIAQSWPHVPSQDLESFLILTTTKKNNLLNDCIAVQKCREYVVRSSSVLGSAQS